MHISEYKNNTSITAIERRLTLQLLTYWERVRGVRTMPEEGDINPDDLYELWDDCFLIHTLDIHQNDYNFIYLGDNIKRAFVGDIAQDKTILNHSLNVKRLVPAISKTICIMAPVIEEGEMVNDLNQRVRYRQCLLPLGQGNKVLAVFGGMRCKVYSHEHTIQ